MSQRASVVTAVMALATMIFLAPLLSWLPSATLAVVVIVYSVGLIQPGEFRKIGQIRMMEFRWAVIACLGVLLFGTLEGIVVAILASLLGLASQTVQPPLHVIGRKPGEDVLRPLAARHPDDETIPGLLILRPEGRLFFINVQHVAVGMRELIARHQPRVVVLDMSRVQDVEYSALMMLMEGEQLARSKGLRSGWPDSIPGARECAPQWLGCPAGESRMLFNARAAIRQYQQNQG